MSHNKRCGDIVSLHHALISQIMYPLDRPALLLTPVGQCVISSTVEGEIVTIRLAIAGVLDHCFTCKPVIMVEPEHTTPENVHYPQRTTVDLVSSMGLDEYQNLLSVLN